MAAVFKPDVGYDEGVIEAITDMLVSDKRLIIASNHLSNTDQYVIAAMAKRERTLHPMLGKTFIPSKVPLFDESNLFYKLRRYGIDEMGGIPAFRVKDVEGMDASDSSV